MLINKRRNREKSERWRCKCYRDKAKSEGYGLVKETGKVSAIQQEKYTGNIWKEEWVGNTEETNARTPRTRHLNWGSS